MPFFKLRKRQRDKPENSIPKSNSQHQENSSDTTDRLNSLWVAFKGKDDARCLSLIEQGARWEGTTPPVDYCKTALHLASGYNLLETCKELIRRGADVNAIDANGNTPLYEAAGFGNAEVCELLLRNGAIASLELKNRDGYTPLLEAREYSNDAAAKVLLEFGAKSTFTPNREEQRTTQNYSEVMRGGFGEPYCSQTCYSKACEEITTITFVVAHGVCSICQRPTDSGSARAFFPYRGQYFYVCNGCIPEAKEFVRRIKDCCVCGKLV